MPEKLTLNNGTELERASAIRSELTLFVYVPGSDLRTVFGLLIEQQNVQRIVYTQNNGDEIIFSGFTKLVSVSDEGNGLITAALKREVID